MNKREWNMFDRCYSGLLKNEFLGNKVRFLTLTTAPVTADGLSDIEKLDLIRKNFDNLKKRYEKEFDRSFGEYFRVSTLEGYGVIHILFSGAYVPYSWLVVNWNEIHGSCIVDIRGLRGNSYESAMYVIGQYVSDQEGRKIFGYSRNWVYSGFTKDLKECENCSKDWSDQRYKYGMWYAPVDYKRFKVRWTLFLYAKIKGVKDVRVWNVKTAVVNKIANRNLVDENLSSELGLCWYQQPCLNFNDYDYLKRCKTVFQFKLDTWVDN